MQINKNNFPFNEDTFSRIAPFGLFMAFIAIQEGVQYLSTHGIVGMPDSWNLYLYPVKTVAVALLLLYYRKSYTEISCRDLAKIKTTLLGIFTGIIVFALWVNMDWTWATIGSSKGFDPTNISQGFTQYTLIAFRIAGASIVVPVMEELFWRSWLLRYIISQDYRSVEIGRFTLSSFLIGSLMFGFEHNLWLAGIMAGVAYSLLLYRTKSLAQCILAHGITNLLLGIYVLNTGKWYFW